MLSTIGMLVYVYVLMQAFEQMGRARSNSSVILAALTVWAATGTTYDFVVIPPQFGVAQQAVGTEISKPISPATWLLLALVVFAVSTVAAARGLRRIFEDAPHPPGAGNDGKESVLDKKGALNGISTDSRLITRWMQSLSPCLN